MRLSISNIAWDVAEDEAIASLLKHFAVDAIDIAPGKYFPEPGLATSTQINDVRQWWQSRGIEIVGMQALLFGTTGLNVFGSAESQNKLLEHLQAVCRIGASIGAHYLVFGSPKNRDRTGFSDAQAHDTAMTFFNRLGDIAHAEGVCMCLESNPSCYGANFMTNSIDTAKVVSALSHPAIRMQLDTGAIAINEENTQQVLENYAHLIGHIHASEPSLLPLGDSSSDHAHNSQAINKYLPGKTVTIEMVATQNEPHLDAITRALTVANQYYATRTPA